VKKIKVNTLVLAGGVAANSALNAKFTANCEKEGIKFYHPNIILCTDNAAMIACRAFYQSRAGLYSDLYLNAVPSLKLTNL
jgi:N6-L-threonylcarbamoyladenine synthase